MTYSITLAGQDITLYTDQMSVEVDDTLGQGSGAGSSGGTQGRATTVKFNTSLGPVATALGAGQPLIPTDPAMLFPGTGVGSVITLASGLQPAGWSAFSFEFWFSLSSTSASFCNLLYNFAGGSTAGVGIFLNPNAGFLEFELSTGASSATASTAVSLTLGNWYHYAGVWDGATITHYLNGVKLGSGVAYTAGIGTGANPLRLGTQSYPGAMNKAAIYNHALTPDRILAHYQAGIRLQSTAIYSSLILSDIPIAYYPMNETGGTLVRDSSGNGYNGTLGNGIALAVPGVSLVPRLIRQGEIIVRDASGLAIFGGYATKYTDSTTSVLGQNRQNFTTIEGIDYSTSLQRTLVNETFSGQTDIQIIRAILLKYAPWVNRQLLPKGSAYLFPIKIFRNVSVEQVLQTIAGVTGYLVFVDYLKYIHYVPPTIASSAPFNLSDSPDFVTTFPHAVTEYVVDDNSAINRVSFYGGTRLSNNYWQDLSPMVNGNNKTFTLAYFPTPMADGKYHVQLGGSNGVGGTEQTVGTANTGGAANTFISQGGTAQVIIDSGSRSLTFDTAPSGTGLFVGYRYSFPLNLVLTDETSHAFFGDPYLDGFINDNTIFDLTTAVQRCKVLLAQQSFGLTSLKVDVYKAGIQAGMLIQVTNTLRGINGTYLVQQVQISPLGGGNFVYHVSLGAWNWNLIDWLLKLPTLAAFQDDQQNEAMDIVDIKAILSNIKVHDAWSQKTSVGPYYARAAVVGDGHDSFPGFATISS